jgi:hypothetical protein
MWEWTRSIAEVVIRKYCWSHQTISRRLWLTPRLDRHFRAVRSFAATPQIIFQAMRSLTTPGAALPGGAEFRERLFAFAKTFNFQRQDCSCVSAMILLPNIKTIHISCLLLPLLKRIVPFMTLAALNETVARLEVA